MYIFMKQNSEDIDWEREVSDEELQINKNQ
jgi:hypothetical protein